MSVFEAVFVLLLFMVEIIHGSACSDKITEATCGSGCMWTNGTGGSCAGTTVGGSCSGTATCTGTNNAKCAGTAGCNWADVIPAKCDGSAVCAVQTTSTSCGGAEGLGNCQWTASTPDTCTGTPATCGTTEAGCKISGCSWAGEPVDATCAGTITSCSNGNSSRSVCEAISGCTYHQKCKYISDDCAYYGVRCNLIKGCTYTDSTGTCTVGSDPFPDSCESLSDNLTRCNAAGCTGYANGECGGTPTVSIPSNCLGLSFRECDLLRFFGCFWENSECRGDASISGLCEDIVIDMGTCANYGCTADTSVRINHCSINGKQGLKYSQCSDITIGSDCLIYGCTGMTAEICDGTADSSEFESIQTGQECWVLNDVGFTDYSNTCWESGGPITVQCGDFSSNQDYCAKIEGCTYTASSGGCGGTPDDSPAIGCGNSPIKDSKGNCEANNCNWTPETGTCTGTSTDTCSKFDSAQSKCNLITGCSYTGEVAAKCSGTASVTACTEATTEGACTNANGCAWSPDSCSSLGQAACTGTCSWNQPGTCTAESRAVPFLCVPAMLVLLLLALFL